MSYTDLLVKAMTYKKPETIPVSVFVLPALWKKYPDGIKKTVSRYPQFFGDLGDRYNYETYTPVSYHEGNHTDEWGCVWSNIQEGMESIVTEHPVKTREEIHSLEIPGDRTGHIPHGFMYLRILDLRGFEEAMLDFAEEPPELQMLIDKVLEYNLIQTDIAIKKNSGPIQSFGDDLGMQKGLAIGREKWLKYMKPCFTTIYKKVHDAGKLVYMHTDGCIWEIMGDLREAGVDMVNPQYRANGLENLVRVCKGKIPINLDIDRQMLPFATPASIEGHIRECVEALYLPAGGLGINLELGMDVNLEVMDAALAALEKYRHYKG
ncbi:MAG: uroporphyrinogen decarboxylase family protein [Treponema sp.]|nr:uroporphyrinogen decarboxylase family protein [Treponema sp.]